MSTDSKKYLKFLEKYNYKFKNFLRPKTLSKSNSTDLEVLTFELKDMKSF